MKRNVRDKMVKNGLAYGGNCDGCGMRMKLFSPVGKGTKKWGVLERALLRNEYCLCAKCWQKKVLELGKDMGANLDEIKRNYLDERRA